MHNAPIDRSLRWLYAALALCAILWMATLGARALLDPDEGRYGEIPREMAASGDWLTPRLNDLKYFEKPPLQYWTTAIAYKAFGVNEFSARLWCGLTGLLGIFAAAWMGARLFGRTAGVVAAAVLGSSLMYAVLGHINTLDMGLAFFLQLAIGAFLLAQQAPPASSSERNWMLLAWAAAALAVLSKGIVALALPTLTLLAYTAIERETSAWRRLHIKLGLPVFLALTAPWFIAVSLKNPEFARFFFLHEHFQRFLTDEAKRVQPWWYFVPLLLIGSLPWTELAVTAVIGRWRSSPSAPAGFRSQRFLVLWIVVTLLFFSVSQSKLPPYILPVLPAVAWLIGDHVSQCAAGSMRRRFMALAIFWLLALVYVLFGPLPTRDDASPEMFRQVFDWAAAGFALALAGAICAWWLARRERILASTVCAAFGALLAVSSLFADFDLLRHVRSRRDLAQQLAPLADPNKPFYSVWTYDHSLSFYLGRALTVVDYRGELEFGQQQEPTKSLPNTKAFLGKWLQDPPGTLAVMKPDAYQELVGMGAPMTVIERGLELIAVKKP